MPELVVQDKYTQQIPRFSLPAEFSNAPEAKAEPKTETPAAPATPVVEATPESAPETPPKAEAEVKTEAKPEEKETTEKEPERNATRRFERRMDRAIRAKAEAQARAELAEKRAAEAEARLQAKAEPKVDGTPKMEDFTDVQEYAKAVAKFEVEQDRKAREEKSREESRNQELTQISSSWEEHVEKGVDKYDDFQEVVGDLKPDSEWKIAIMQQDNAAEVAYYLGKHEKEAQRIIALHPRRQHQEIAKLSAKLSLQPEAPKKPSKAPEPIKPVTGAAETSEPDPFKPQSYEDYVRNLKKAAVPFGKR